jgi:MFS family permease
MKKRHGVLLLLTSLAVLTYLDRLCISVLGPTMKEELGLSPEQWGWVLGAFTLAYGSLEIPGGALGDRFGQRKVLLRIVVWWSLFTALTGAVSSFALLLVVRFLFGAGEAGAFPNISGSASRWFPAAERARVQGLVWGASRLGAVLAPLLVGLIVARFQSWRAAFWIFGGVGLVWGVIWYVMYRDDPAQHPDITEEELKEIGVAADRSAHQAIPWGRLFRAPQLWLIMVMYSFYVWGSTFYLTWLPVYLVEGRGFSKEEMNWIAPLPFVLGALANPLGGVLSDGLSRKLGLKVGRRVMGSTCLAVASLFLLATALTTGRWSGILLLAVGFGVLDLMLSSAWAVCMDVGGKYAGAVSGAMNSFGHTGGTLCSVLFGYLVSWYGSYNAPLFLIAAMVLVAAFLFAWIDPSRPLLRDEEGSGVSPTHLAGELARRASSPAK